MKNYNAGNAGEDFYLQVICGVAFKSKKVQDTRNSCKEGEVSIGDKWLYRVELKQDNCAEKTGNVIIEVGKVDYQSGNKGWLKHCQQNKVDDVIFCLYDNKNKISPVRSFRIAVDDLAAYVETQEKNGVMPEEMYDSFVYKARIEELIERYGMEAIQIRQPLTEDERAIMPVLFGLNPPEWCTELHHIRVSDEPEEWRIVFAGKQEETH